MRLRLREPTDQRNHPFNPLIHPQFSSNPLKKSLMTDDLSGGDSVSAGVPPPRSMAYILHHSTTFHAHGSGYQQIDENGQSRGPAHGHAHTLLGGAHGNTSVRAAFIHVVGDLLQSLGVMVAATIIYVRVSPPCDLQVSSSQESQVPL